MGENSKRKAICCKCVYMEHASDGLKLIVFCSAYNVTRFIQAHVPRFTSRASICWLSMCVRVHEHNGLSSHSFVCSSVSPLFSSYSDSSTCIGECTQKTLTNHDIVRIVLRERQKFSLKLVRQSLIYFSRYTRIIALHPMLALYCCPKRLPFGEQVTKLRLFPENVRDEDVMFI